MRAAGGGARTHGTITDLHTEPPNPTLTVPHTDPPNATTWGLSAEMQVMGHHSAHHVDPRPYCGTSRSGGAQAQEPLDMSQPCVLFAGPYSSSVVLVHDQTQPIFFW